MPSAPPPQHRLARTVLLAATAGMAVVTILSASATAPAVHRAAARHSLGSAWSASGWTHLALTPTGSVHIEAVSAPVVLTAAELEQAMAAAPPPGGGSGSDLGTFTVTCYAIHGRTATGSEAGPDSVAVDPSVIPLGSHLYIAGVGYRTADDTGGYIRGHHIDIWESTTSACAAFGRQYRDVRRIS